jgi:endopeptidase Clp ATP-binding regulatory subunit ClpX
MRCIAKLIGVPYVKADATKFSETGYVGHDVEDLVRDLVRLANGDTELAQYGIIYVDEIDKIASAPTTTKDVSGRGVQTNLLKLMEDTEVSLHSQTDLIGQVQAVMDMQRGKDRKQTINTRHMLFIVSGAFEELSGQVRNRLESSRIGFGEHSSAAPSDGDYLKRVQTRDFIKYGFEPEFIGRLPVRVVCDRLSASDLEEIVLRSEDSIMRQYQSDFAGYGIEFSVTPEAVTRIAERAAEENTGARGLMTVFERILRNYKFELPSTSVTAFEVSTEAVDDPEAVLRALLKSGQSGQVEVLRADIASFAARFESQYGFRLTFTKAAIDALVDLSIAQDTTIRAICEDKFRDFQHGLSLASRNSGKTAFTITKKLVDAPARELSKIVARSFGKE